MIRHDLIGRTVKVVQADNPSLTGTAGECVEETQHTLRVRTDRGEKTLLKEQVTIEVGGRRIKGSVITGRPHERTKLKVTRWQKTTNK